ncbi:hypothetical protein [Methanopyrus sp.]
MRGLRLVAAALIGWLWCAVAWSAVNPRYVIHDGKVTYPWLRDGFRTLEMPVVMGPVTDTWVPWRVVQASEWLIWGWLEAGPDRLALGPLTYRSSGSWAKLMRASEGTRVSGYGLKSGDSDLIFRGFLVDRGGRWLVLLCPGGPVLVLGGKIREWRVFGEVYVSLRRGMVIAVLPERVFWGVHVWKPSLRLSSLGLPP